MNTNHLSYAYGDLPIGDALELLQTEEPKPCQLRDPEDYFPESRGRPKKVTHKEARDVCEGCPVIVECFEFAMANNTDGIWGGTTRERRKVIRIQQSRQ